MFSDNFSGVIYNPRRKIGDIVQTTMFSMWFNTKFVRVSKKRIRRIVLPVFYYACFDVINGQLHVESIFYHHRCVLL